MISVPLNLDKQLTFKVAETPDEIMRALEVLYESYREYDLTEVNDHGIRATIYHALPTTTVLLAKYADEVIGTLTLIRESPVGLPAEKHYDLQFLRRKGYSVAEVSSLAIKKEWRGKIFIPFLKFFYEYCQTYYSIDSPVLTTYGPWIEFYESILLFDLLPGGPIEKYDFSNGVRAVGEYLDLKTAPMEYYKVYAGQRKNRDLFRYFTLDTVSNFKLPEREVFQSFDSYLSPDLIDLIFNKMTKIFENLDDETFDKVKDVYRSLSLAHLLPERQAVECRRLGRRDHFRFPVHMAGVFLITGKEPVRIETMEVSATGLKVRSAQVLNKAEDIKIQIQIGPYKVVNLMVQRIWSAAGSIYGYRIVQSDSLWIQMIHDLVEQTNKEYA